MEIQINESQVKHKFHHDSRPYAVASAEAAAKAKTKLLTRFDAGKAMLGAALQSVEDSIPEDALVPNDNIIFDLSEGKISVGFKPNKTAQPEKFLGIHDHAFGQLLEKADIPKKYADRLLEENPALLLTNLRSRYTEDKLGKKYLSRAVGGEIRGWLSDSYGRYDVKPMVESFLNTCMAFGAVPVDSRNLPTRFFLKMMIPIVYEPVPNEVLAFGIQFRSSDFGDGAYEIRGFLSRVWCTNDAMTEDCLRQVHLGPKLTAANFSHETLEKQTAMLASATKDTVNGILKPANIEKRLLLIKSADESQISIEQALHRMRSNRELTKAEAERVQEILTTSDTEVLPPVREKPKKGHTSLYRFANAFSALANEEDVDRSRAMDFENLAGKVMGLQSANKA